jgi:hypothetical protein
MIYSEKKIPHFCDSFVGIWRMLRHTPSFLEAFKDFLQTSLSPPPGALKIILMELFPKNHSWLLGLRAFFFATRNTQTFFIYALFAVCPVTNPALMYRHFVIVHLTARSAFKFLFLHASNLLSFWFIPHHPLWHQQDKSP